MYQVTFQKSCESGSYTIRLESWQKVIRWLGRYSGISQVYIMAEDPQPREGVYDQGQTERLSCR